MRKLFIILVLAAVGGIVVFFYKNLVATGGKSAAITNSYIDVEIDKDAPIMIQTTQNDDADGYIQTENEDNYYSYIGEENEKEIKEVFKEGSAQHNYTDITETPKKKKKKMKKEDKHKYFKTKKQEQELISFDKQYKNRNMSKEELYSELMDAIYFDEIPKALALIKKGASVNSPDDDADFTPIFMALSNGSVDMVRMLLDKGADLNIYDEKGLTPIHRIITQEGYTGSSYYPATELIEVLLEYGADINKPTKKEQFTPLIYSAQEHKAKIMQYLLESGANDELTDKKGLTVLDYAKQYECTACLKLLLN